MGATRLLSLNQLIVATKGGSLGILAPEIAGRGDGLWLVVI